MGDWPIWGAKHRGALVARIFCRSWYTSPPPLDLSASEFALVAPLLLGSHAAALVWNKLRNASIDLPLRDEFHNAYRFCALQSEMHAIDLLAALARLRRAGIDAIAHKGYASARLYPQPELRSYSDIDLIVRPDQLDAAQATLDLPPQIMFPIELEHTELSEFDSIVWEQHYGHSQVVKLGAEYVRILAPEHHLRALCIHCLKHGVANPLWLADVAVAIERAGEKFDWELCLGRQEPQANWVRSVVSLAHCLLQADVRGTPVTDFIRDLPGWLVRDVLRRWSRIPRPLTVPTLSSVFRRKSGLVEACVIRWPSAGRATLESKAKLTWLPDTHLRMRVLLAPARLKRLASYLPALWRSDATT